MTPKPLPGKTAEGPSSQKLVRSHSMSSRSENTLRPVRLHETGGATIALMHRFLRLPHAAQTPLTQYFLQQGARMYAFATTIHFARGPPLS